MTTDLETEPETVAAEEAMTAQSFSELDRDVLREVIRQFRATRNDILRYGVWNVRNLTDEEFNHTDDRKLLGYFQSDLLETRFITRGRRIDLLQIWQWFDDQMSGAAPLLLDDEEVMLEVRDKDLEKVRKRIAELRTFFPTIRSGDVDAFKRVKYKLRRVVMRLTYDLHHLSKRLDKYMKNAGMSDRNEPPADVAPLGDGEETQPRRPGEERRRRPRSGE